MRAWGDGVGLADLHAHLLPGLGDGPVTVDGALKRLREAYADGMRVVYAVSGPAARADVDAASRVLRRAVRNAQLALDIEVGHHVALTPQLAAEFAGGKILPLGHTGYVCVELPRDAFPSYTLDVLYHLTLEGARVLLIRPERNRALLRNPQLVGRLRDMEMVGVAAADDLRRGASPAVRRETLWLIERGLIQAIASNASAHRAARLTDLTPLLARHFGLEAAEGLICHTPLAIHAGFPVEMRPHARRWLSRLSALTPRVRVPGP